MKILISIYIKRYSMIQSVIHILIVPLHTGCLSPTWGSPLQSAQETKPQMLLIYVILETDLWNWEMWRLARCLQYQNSLISARQGWLAYIWACTRTNLDTMPMVRTGHGQAAPYLFYLVISAMFVNHVRYLLTYIYLYASVWIYIYIIYVFE